MANRVTTLKTHVLLAGGSTRVTSLKLSAFAAISDAAIRATTLKLGAFTNDKTHGVRATTLKLGVYADDHTHGVRATTLKLALWSSLDQSIQLGEPFGSNEVYTPADVSQKASYIAPPPPVIEVNPFRADVPNVDQQRILREQHNKAQAGDSTFHWGVLTEISATPLYNLGSVGRFYHDQYGIAHAVYVRFSNMEPVEASAFPVGFDLKNLEPWTVTNRLERSSRDFAAGVACIYNESIYTPGTWFGWIIIEGFVPAELKCELVDSQLLLGTEYGWSATGEVSATTDGDSLGIRWTTHKVPVLKPGEFRVRVNSLSQARLNGLIAAQVGPLSSQLGDLTTRVSQLEATSAAHTQQIGQLQSQIVGVDNRLSKDIANLANQMAALRRMIPSTDYESYVNTQVNALDVKLSNQIASVGQVALQANSKADDALGLIAGFNVDGLQNQIDALNDSMGSLTSRLTGFETVIDTNTLMPGMILVAIDAGLTPGGLPLVKFEPQVPTLGLLDDVDLTTPPTDGDALCWDNTAGMWVPNASGGSGLPDAPSDGKTYGRKNAAWVEVTGGGGGGPSWSNGCTERRFLIESTATGGSTGLPGNALSAGPISNFYWNTGTATKTLTWEFTSPNIVQGLAISQNVATANGTWTIEGSNDGSTWTSIIADYVLGGTSYGPGFVPPGNLFAREFANSTAYLYYRMVLNSGQSTSNVPYVTQIMFKCEPL